MPMKTGPEHGTSSGVLMESSGDALKVSVECFRAKDGGHHAPAFEDPLNSTRKGAPETHLMGKEEELSTGTHEIALAEDENGDIHVPR